MKSKILKWGNFPGLSGWALNANPSVLTREGWRRFVETEEENAVPPQAERRVMRAGVSEWCPDPTAAQRGKESMLPYSLRGEHSPASNLDFSPTRLFWTSSLQNSEKINSYYDKPPSLSQVVTATTGN